MSHQFDSAQLIAVESAVQEIEKLRTLADEPAMKTQQTVLVEIADRLSFTIGVMESGDAAGGASCRVS